MRPMKKMSAMPRANPACSMAHGMVKSDVPIIVFQMERLYEWDEIETFTHTHIQTHTHTHIYIYTSYMDTSDDCEPGAVEEPIKKRLPGNTDFGMAYNTSHRLT